MADLKLTLMMCVLATLPASVFPCTCIHANKPVKERLCMAEFAIKAEVTEVQDRTYRDSAGYNETGKVVFINIQETYRATEKYLNLTVKNEIMTRISSATCGWLPPKGVYILTGYIYDNQYPAVSSCDYARMWSDASEGDRKVFTDYAAEAGDSCVGENSTATVTASHMLAAVSVLLGFIIRVF